MQKKIFVRVGKLDIQFCNPKTLFTHIFSLNILIIFFFLKNRKEHEIIFSLHSDKHHAIHI